VKSESKSKKSVVAEVEPEPQIKPGKNYFGFGDDESKISKQIKTKTKIKEIKEVVVPFAKKRETKAESKIYFKKVKLPIVEDVVIESMPEI